MFISKELLRRVYDNHVVLNFSRHGKPAYNPYIEVCKGNFRDECLSVKWFLDIEDTRQKIEALRRE
jgi:putative transposase